MGDNDAFDVIFSGLKGVQNDATGHGVRMDRDANTVVNASNAAAGAGDSSAVARALQGFRDHVARTRGLTGGRTGNAVQGLGEAAGAYRDADDAMAAGVPDRRDEGTFKIPGAHGTPGPGDAAAPPSDTGGKSLKDLIGMPGADDKEGGGQ